MFAVFRVKGGKRAQFKKKIDRHTVRLFLDAYLFFVYSSKSCHVEVDIGILLAFQSFIVP